MTGRLVAVVGPSGVGKDSVIGGLVAARPGIAWVRRAVTRPPSQSEPFESVAEAEFVRRRDAGAFCLHWRAHGLGYGVPATARDAVRAGRTMVVNLSRGVLADADALFPRLRVLSITARPDTLARRLAARGREGEAAIAARLSRRVALPPGLDVAEIPNDGTLGDAVARACAALAAFDAGDARMDR